MSDLSLHAGERDFAADESLLAEVLREVIGLAEGPAAVALLDRAVSLGRAARLGDAAAADQLATLAAELDLDRAEVLVRSLTRWFQLVNLAEDNERVRRLRARDAEAVARASGRPARTARPGQSADDQRNR